MEAKVTVISVSSPSLTLASASPASRPTGAKILHRQCACGQHTIGGEECEECKKGRMLERQASSAASSGVAPPIVHEVLRSLGQPLDAATRAFFEPRFGHDFSNIRVHTDSRAAESARAVRAAAYTVGQQVVFGSGQYAPHSYHGKQLLAHELAHCTQQVADSRSENSSNIPISEDANSERDADRTAEAVVFGRPVPASDMHATQLHRRASPYIKKVTVHLTPPQSADLQWEGTAPSDAPGADHFTVSTGKGYSDPGDPAGTCTRTCCGDADKQCAPPWNQPGSVGACCTYFGNNFWTGTSLEEHNGWKWWTPIQPYYSSRGIALHQHDEVTGQPIGHGCVRMEEANAKRIHDFSNGQNTNVTIDGRAAPVKCDEDRKCANKTDGGTGKAGVQGELEPAQATERITQQEAVPGLEGLMS